MNTSTYQSLPDSIKTVIHRIVQALDPQEIVLFGSRARGDHRENSDFDIAVKATAIPFSSWARLQAAVDEEPLTLYRVDLVEFNSLNDEYKRRILSEGKTIYVR